MLRERARTSMAVAPGKLVMEGVWRLTALSGSSRRMSPMDALVILASEAVLNITRMLSLVEVMTFPRW